MGSCIFRVFDDDGNKTIYMSAHEVARKHFRNGVPYDAAKIETGGISYEPGRWYELFLDDAFDDDY